MTTYVDQQGNNWERVTQIGSIILVRNAATRKLSWIHARIASMMRVK